MAGKARVHELAKELGVTSKEVLARLSEQGEFVKSASSTVEAPVARRLRESFGGSKTAAQKAPARVAAPAAAQSAATVTNGGAAAPAPAPRCPPHPRPKPGAPRPAAVQPRRRRPHRRCPPQSAPAPAAPAPARRPRVPPRARDRAPSPPRRVRRAWATTRSLRSSPSSGRFRGRRPGPPARGPDLAPADRVPVPASRPATCPRGRPALLPVVRRGPVLRGPAVDPVPARGQGRVPAVRRRWR